MCDKYPNAPKHANPAKKLTNASATAIIILSDVTGASLKI